MPFFHYTAGDKKGASVEGTIQASSRDEARALLTQRGFQVRSVIDPHSNEQKPASPQAPSGAKPAVVQPAFPGYKGTDRERFFLFAQIAAQLRAGIAPAQAFPTLATQLSNRGYSESLHRIAQLTAVGRPMSEVMAEYPGLYPEHVVGLVRAGEAGGFLPEACAAVSEQAGAAHQFRIWHWFLWVTAIGGLILIPTVMLSMMSFNQTFIKMWTGNDEVGSGWVLRTMLVMFFRSLAGPTGLILLLFYGAIFGGLYMLRRPRSTRFRHALGLRFPGYGKRAIHENLTMFTWALGSLSRGGVAPLTAWKLASECAPNVAIKEQLVGAGNIMQTESRVSDAVFRSGLFPEDYAPMISTGEMVGDLPGALERLAQTSRGEYESQTQYARYRAVGWGCVMSLVAGIGGFAMLYYVYSKLLTYMDQHGAD